MKTQTSRNHFVRFVFFTALALAAPSLFARTIYWDPWGPGSFGTVDGTNVWAPALIKIWTDSDTGGSTRIPTYTTTLNDFINFGGPTAALGGGTIPVDTVDAGTISFNTISGSGAIFLSGGTITLAATTSITVKNTSDTISSTLAGAATSLTKAGPGTLQFTGINTYTGATAVNAGTLTLDYSTQDDGKLSDVAALVLGGGTVKLNGGTHTELVASATLTAGTASSVTRGTDSAVLQMNTITRNAAATVNFGAPNIATTDNNNTNGILGAWATIGGTDWAVNSTDAADGLITAATDAYTDVTRLNDGLQVIADDATSNVRIIEGTGSPANLTMGAATTTVNTLNQSAVGGASAATIDPAGQTLLLSGILVGTGAGGLTIGTGAANGALSAATAGGELLLINNTANGCTINSLLADNSTSTLTKAGAGTLTLAGANTYAGGTALTAGTLQLGNAGALGTGTLTLSGGNLDSSIASLVNTNNNAQAWNADFTFVGSQDLDLGTGSVTMNASRQVTVAANTLTVGGAIGGGAFSLTKAGAGTLTLSGASTYTGVTIISAGTLSISSIDVVANANPLGKSTAAAANLLLGNGTTLKYTGGAASTDRGFTINGTAAGHTATLDASGTGAINFTGTSSPAYGTANQTRTLNLTGSNTGANTLAANIGNNGTGAVSLTKNGAGTWVLSGANTYSGATTIKGGALWGVTGGSCANSAVTVTNTPGNVAALGVRVTDSARQWTCASLAFNTNGDGAQLQFSFAVAPSATLAPLSIAGDLTFNGAPLVVVDPTNLGGGVYPLLVVGGAAPAVVPELRARESVSGRLFWGGPGNKTLFFQYLSGGCMIIVR